MAKAMENRTLKAKGSVHQGAGAPGTGEDCPKFGTMVAAARMPRPTVLAVDAKSFSRSLCRLAANFLSKLLPLVRAVTRPRLSGLAS